MPTVMLNCRSSFATFPRWYERIVVTAVTSRHLVCPSFRPSSLYLENKALCVPIRVSLVLFQNACAKKWTDNYLSENAKNYRRETEANTDSNHFMYFVKTQLVRSRQLLQVSCGLWLTCTQLVPWTQFAPV